MRVHTRLQRRTGLCKCPLLPSPPPPPPPSPLFLLSTTTSSSTPPSSSSGRKDGPPARKVPGRPPPPLRRRRRAVLLQVLTGAAARPGCRPAAPAEAFKLARSSMERFSKGRPAACPVEQGSFKLTRTTASAWAVTVWCTVSAPQPSRSLAGSLKPLLALCRRVRPAL